MEIFDSAPLFIGTGFALPVPQWPAENTLPTGEYIAPGPGRFTPTIPWAIPQRLDDVSRHFTHRTVDAMLTDPAVWSSYLALKLGILDGGLQLRATDEPDPTKLSKPRAKAGPIGPAEGDGEDVGPDPGVSPDEANAKWALEFCRRLIARLPDVEAFNLQMLDAMGYGVKLYEPTYRVAEFGEDAGMLVLDSLKVKPYWAWQFVVDCFLNVKGLLTYVPAVAAFRVLPPDKFGYYTFLPKDNDPRGSNVLRCVHDAWNLKLQLLPQYYAFNVRFGQPGLDFEMAEGDDTPRVPVGPDGLPMTDAAGNPVAPLAPEVYHGQNLDRWRGGAVFVHPNGSKLAVTEPTGSGESFMGAFDWADRQICLGVGLQVRASLEAKNGSKADSETAQDTRGLIIGYGRKSFASFWRHSILKRAIALNKGEEFAERYTPLCSFGQAEQQDKPAMWSAASSLFTAGAIGDSQKPGMNAILGLPEQDIEADMKAQADRDAAQAALRAKALPPPGEGGGKAKSKPKPEESE